MKRIKWMNLTSVVCASIMILTLTACGSSDKVGSKGTAPANSTAGNSVEQKIDPNAKYDPILTVTSVRQDLGTTYTFDDGETMENNVWSKAYENNLGVKIKYNWIVSADQYQQKFGVAVASNDLPDIFDVNAKDFAMLVENDMLADLTDVFELYASPLTKDIITQDGGIGLQTATVNGKLMAIPETNSISDLVSMIWIRADWLKKLNLQEPKTMDELIKVAEAFVTQDPDGNNKNDTYGFAINKDAVTTENPGGSGWADLSGIYYGYHAYMDGWIKDTSGNLVYGSIQPEMKTALAKLQEMFKSGLLDPEFGVKDPTKVAESTSAGKIGIAFGMNWNALWPLNSSKDNDPNADWIPLSIVSADDKPALSLVASPVTNWHVANKNFKNPEVVVKLVNEWVDKSYGPNADPNTYSNSPEGKEMFKTSLNRIWPATKNLECYLAVNEAIKTKDTSKLNPEAKGYYEKTMGYLAGDNTLWGTAAVFGPSGSQGICEAANRNKSWMFNEFYGAPTATMLEKDATLKKIETETFMKIIMNKVSVDEFDKFVTQWKQLGGDQITKEVNDWYSAKK